MNSLSATFWTITTIATILILESTNGSNMDYALQKTRNQYLRFYISAKKSQTKQFIYEIWKTVGLVDTTNRLAESTKEKTQKIYNSVLSKYHDAHIYYYSMSQENRELIEQIINLHF